MLHQQIKRLYTVIDHDPEHSIFRMNKEELALIQKRGRTSKNLEKIYQDLPYTFIPMRDDLYLPVNRKYKPLGYNLGTLVDYNDYACRFIRINHNNKELTTNRNNYLYLWLDPYSPRTSIKNYRRYFRLLNEVIDEPAKLIISSK